MDENEVIEQVEQIEEVQTVDARRNDGDMAAGKAERKEDSCGSLRERMEVRLMIHVKGYHRKGYAVKGPTVNGHTRKAAAKTIKKGSRRKGRDAGRYISNFSG